jgi:hypothetical protein
MGKIRQKFILGSVGGLCLLPGGLFLVQQLRSLGFKVLAIANVFD